jgi:hypothetical protein
MTILQNAKTIVVQIPTEELTRVVLPFIASPVHDADVVLWFHMLQPRSVVHIQKPDLRCRLLPERRCYTYHLGLPFGGGSINEFRNQLKIGVWLGSAVTDIGLMY